MLYFRVAADFYEHKRGYAPQTVLNGIVHAHQLVACCVSSSGIVPHRI